MTSEQAEDFQKFLIDELNRYGFGPVADEALITLENQLEPPLDTSSTRRLSLFIKFCVESLENISNKDFDRLLNRLNEFSTPEKKMIHL